ncbi:MAG: lipase [Mediterranea massiliensis]|nr:lipase [Mediterranea massiliensis]
MRTPLLIITLLASSLLCTLKAQQKDFANYSRYANSNKELAITPTPKNRVVFMGNSITEEWVRLRPEFFSNNQFIGRGISGQTSQQFLLRFREDVIKLHPRLVVINAGTNDIAENTGPYNEEITFGNIVSMVELAKANKIKVILTSVLPASHFYWDKQVTNVPQKIASLNERIRQYAKQEKIPYVDYHSEMVFGEEQSLNPAYTKDGVHPLPQGYEVMERLILQSIKKAL